MQRRLWNAAALAATLAATTAAQAQFVIDGKAEALYGSALSVQNTNTQFGNNSSPDLIATSGGSEINQVFGTIADGMLYVTITGNLEANFNKLEVFLDVDGAARGVNDILGTQLPTQVDGYCCTIGGGVNLPSPDEGALQRMSGLIFDQGFFADYYLTFTHGREETGPVGTSDRIGFWAMSAHFADLTQGTAGAQSSLGMQLAAQGMPQVLRGPLPPDFNVNFDVGGDDLLIWQRNNGKFDGVTSFAGRGDGDANEDAVVNAADLAAWEDRFGDQGDFADFPYVPFNNGPSSTDLAGPVLPDLQQGELIDKNYPHINLARELAFALPPAAGDPNNERNQRDFENTIGLLMALDNSNVAGVSGDGPYDTPTAGDPQNVLTGIEFAIPLASLGNPQGDIRLTAFINGTGHDFASNQFTGEGVLFGNFGALMPDLVLEAPGEQFVTIVRGGAAALASVPEPTSAAVASVLAALVVGVRGTRRESAPRG